MEKQIDIIIPAYKAHKTIFKTLCSIAMQDMSDIIKVTIVDDHCPEGDYKAIVKLFKGQLDIDTRRLPENHGPGYARRYGIEHTSCPYIMFADADDTYTNGFTITEFYNNIIKTKEDIIISNFIEQHEDNTYIPHYSDVVWVFGKIYRRQFLIDHNITFTDMRANEDTCFNRKILIYRTHINKNIPVLNSFTYLWHTTETSITRINHSQYTYDQSICGFVDGSIEMFDWAESQKINQEIIKDEIMGAMIYLYFTYCDVGSYSEVFQEQNLEYIKKFYNKLWKKYNLDFHSQDFIDSFNENMKVWCGETNVASPSKAEVFMAQPNIVQFMDMLADLEYNEDDIYKIQAKIPEDIKQNNINCGVCSKDYYEKK